MLILDLDDHAYLPETTVTKPSRQFATPKTLAPAGHVAMPGAVPADPFEAAVMWWLTSCFVTLGGWPGELGGWDRAIWTAGPFIAIFERSVIPRFWVEENRTQASDPGAGIAARVTAMCSNVRTTQCRRDGCN
jgi:hypothetical protein